MVSNEPDVVENNPTNLLNSVFINIVYTISRLVLTAHKKRKWLQTTHGSSYFKTYSTVPPGTTRFE